MRFPFALTAKIASYIVGQKLRGSKKYATVLQLEPLHTCNLTCTGCGRIREYSTSLKDVMSLEDCLGAAEECGAPMVSICGGEPLIYPQIEALSQGLLNDQKRIVYLCTNAMFMRRKMRAYLAKRFLTEPAAGRGEDVRIAGCRPHGRQGHRRRAQRPQGPRRARHGAAQLLLLECPPRRPGIHARPHRRARRRLQRSHSRHAHGQGARLSGRHQHDDLQGDRHDGNRGDARFPERFRRGRPHHQPRLRVRRRQGRHGQAARPAARRFFLTREGTREKFKNLGEWSERYTILGTPIYHEFLEGKRELECSAWAIPTRNIAGWRGPCYFMAGAGHFPTYQEMLANVDWSKFGVEKDTGKARDPRCDNCMTQCGFEPSGALGLDPKPGDTWKNIKYNFGSRPKASGRGVLVDAYNGVTAGRGPHHRPESHPRPPTQEVTAAA